MWIKNHFPAHNTLGGEKMKKVMQIVDVIAFSILLGAGMLTLISGLSGQDLMVLMFGADISVMGRIIYVVIGLSALLLLITVIARTVMKNKKAKAS